MSVAKRPRLHLSREMRVLMVTAFISGAVLLLLARLRFPELPVAVDTSTQPLERLAARASFEELATRVARVESAVSPNLIVLSLTSDEDVQPVRLGDVYLGAETAREARHVPALRLDGTTAAACLSPTARIGGIVGGTDAAGAGTVVARDAVRHIALVRVPEGRPAVLRQLQLSSLGTPTYVVAVEGTRAGVTLRPVFLGRSDRFTSARWSRPLLPLGGATVGAGALIFTLEGEFLGCAVLDEGAAAIASGTDVLAAVDRIARGVQGLPDPGLTVQTLTPSLADATGAREGVIVADVLEGGPASTVLETGDVILETGGRVATNPKTLLLDLAAQLTEGPVRISFMRGKQVQQGELQLPARPEATEADPWELEAVPRVGTRVVAVRIGSPPAHAGLLAGDVILRLDELAAPTPAQVSSAVRQIPRGQARLLVVRRGARQHVTAIRGGNGGNDVAR
jgi:hypothetical protein